MDWTKKEMTEEKRAKLEEQIEKLPDYDVAWLWNLCQRELERRDEQWPKVKGWRASKSIPEARI
jgi:hypothetical protein